jgi:hypothetical protein
VRQQLTFLFFSARDLDTLLAAPRSSLAAVSANSSHSAIFSLMPTMATYSSTMNRYGAGSPGNRMPVPQRIRDVDDADGVERIVGNTPGMLEP